MTSDNQTLKVQQYLFVHEGQSVQIEAEIAADPDLLKRLVSTWAPAARTGTLEYSELDEHGVVTITLLTRAQPKGLQVIAADPMTALLEAEAGENPVIVVYRRLNELYAGGKKPAKIFVIQAKIESALEAGQKENSLLMKICERLEHSTPVEAPPPAKH